MTYIYTPEEALSIADALSKFLKSQGLNVYIDQALSDEAPYITTLIAKKGELNILFEAQNEVSCDQSLKELAFWLENRRYYAELFIATHIDATFSGSFFRQLDQAGIGLIMVESGKVKIERQPRNPALKVSPEPNLKFGMYKKAVMNCLAKYNKPLSFLTGDNARKDALRDLCELVEGLTEVVTIAAVRKGYLQRSEEIIINMKWSDQINILAAANAYANNEPPFLSEELKTDLHAFRNGRNLVDHKVRSKREEALRQQKFPDRMITGIRLIAELAALKSTILRKHKVNS